MREISTVVSDLNSPKVGADCTGNSRVDLWQVRGCAARGDLVTAPLSRVLLAALFVALVFAAAVSFLAEFS